MVAANIAVLQSRQHQQIEDEVQCYVTELKEKHGTKYTVPQLRFWVTTKNRDSLDNPPDMPPFSGSMR